jgi:predicted nicotinamide N-methyase
MSRTSADVRAFIMQNTAVTQLQLVPEVRLRLVTELTPLWRSTADVLARRDLPPPFWAFAWAGGQALARYVLDNPHLVRGRRVLDFATGSGLVAVAALKAGATQVRASEIDAFSIEAARLNAELNGVSVTLHLGDIVGTACDDIDVVLAGDIFYEHGLSSGSMAWFRSLVAKGKLVLVGDPGRYYSQTHGVALKARYVVPTSREIEDDELRESGVFAIEPS